MINAMNTAASRSCRLTLLFLGLMSMLTTSTAAARTSADVTAALSATGLRPGDNATIAIVLTVHPGLHAQSHKPLDPNLIPLVVKLDPNSSVAFGDVVYPPGQMKVYPQLGAVNVYTDRVTIFVPATVAKDAPLGAVTISGTVRLQACNESMCFPPETQKFQVDTQILAAGAATQPNQPELFTNAPVAAAVATTEPAAKPSSASVIPLSVGPTPPPPPPRIFGLELGPDAYALAFSAAFVIGIIFNAVPCVLPVVPLKIHSFYEASQHSRAKSFALGAVFSAGLIASFVVLAIFVVGLQRFNWGQWFENFWFTITIVAVLLLMTLSTFGLFYINVPNSIASLSPRHDTYVGNFLFGILTAALSTPCTFGMFVALLAWALKAPHLVGVLSIVTVGVGMAFPYLVLSAIPEAARRFPRTGPWSELVKQMMGFMLLGTAFYFAQPLFERVISDQMFWWLMFAVVVAAAIYLIVRAFMLSPNPTPRAASIVIALLLLVPSFWVVRRLTIKPYEWQPYSDTALADATAAGKPVLIDFTATWCGNCHWVEAYVLHDPQVIRAVNDHQLIMMKADVTDDNAPARPLLAKLNPAGAIPLTAIYAPRTNEPRLLNGIYSVGDLVSAIEKTTGG
jgi:thiol:disulfide interchange protein DsbD